jgi:dTDP-4-amino-4,6-dideoxygalactose transaminase
MGVARKAQDERKSAGRVPAIDLGATYADLKQEIDAAVTRVFASGRYIGGPEVEGLESDFASFCGVPHAVAVASGTDALRFSLMAAGVGERGRSDGGSARVGGARPDAPDEIVTSPLTFLATTEAISQAGARFVFVDVDPESLTIDPVKIEKALTPRTRAIVPIHLYGQAADMDPILDLARRRGLAVIEDACQAHGAQYRGSGPGPGRVAPPGRAAGSLGDAGCFSFYPTKNLGGCGEGGLVTTARRDVADRVRRLRDHGQSEKYVHAEEGYNGRLDALQAAILRVKLQRLAGWNARRRALAAQYGERLKEMGLAGAPGDAAARLRLPVEKPWGTHVFHQYTVRLSSGRDRVRAALLEKGVETGVHYPIPLHLQPCYAWMGLKEGSFPEAERAAREVVSLPLYPEMTEAQVDRVCEALRDVLGRGQVATRKTPRKISAESR